MPSTVFRLRGQNCAGPREVCDQSVAAIRAAISPPDCRNAGGVPVGSGPVRPGGVGWGPAIPEFRGRVCNQANWHDFRNVSTHETSSQEPRGAFPSASPLLESR